MKRVLLLAALALTITISIVSGSLSAYTVNIDKLAQGSVMAKEFILLEGGTNTFSADMTKIAPGETVKWDFSVKNHNGDDVSETAMDLDFTVTLAAAQGKNAIKPLEITVTEKGKESVLGYKTGVGTIHFTDEFGLKVNGQEKTYTVSIHWPLCVTSSIYYSGSHYGTSVKVSVTGTQK